MKHLFGLVSIIFSQYLLAEVALLKKYTITLQSTTSVQTITQAQWQKMVPGGKLSLLETFYYSNSRVSSRRGNKNITCFEGNSETVGKAFFSQIPMNTLGELIEGNYPVIKTTLGKIGIYYVVNEKVMQNSTKLQRSFSIDNCSSVGKGVITGSPEKEMKPANNAIITGNETLREPSPLTEVEQIMLAQKGFSNEDKFAQNGLPQFQLKTDFNIAASKIEKLPWRELNLDLRRQADAIKLALILQKYVYEGMFPAKAANNDFHLNAFQNPIRYWCHMPWLQLGANGRESIHGLTKELDLKPSPYMSSYKDVAKGSNWGVAYYNSPACLTISKIFGWSSKIKVKPDFNNVNFNEGSLSFKMLFTTSPDEKFKDAYTWNAHVSGIKQTERSVQSIKHIQMDISLRDSFVKGTLKSNNHWIMLTYYFDPTYDYKNEYRELLNGQVNPVVEIQNLPEGILKMRPMGIQIGFGPKETGDSIIFPGSETNEKFGRLNGPADNPKSSCFSCHGTAGSTMPMVPGIMSNEDFSRINTPGQHFDFGQQVLLAFKNYNSFIMPKISNASNSGEKKH